MTDKVADGAKTAAAVEKTWPRYDPNNLSPEDEEARKYDDTSYGIDWDEIIVGNQDDLAAGRYAYNSADYATEAEAKAALHAFFQEILEEVLNGIRSLPSRDSESST